MKNSLLMRNLWKYLSGIYASINPLVLLTTSGSRRLLALLVLYSFQVHGQPASDVGPLARNPSPAGPPNIVYILADDVGWRDLGCYGSTYYKTPNIDRFAEQGIRFTNSYAYPQCSPSRFGLLTGQNPARAGLTRAIIPGDHKRGGPREMISDPRTNWYLANPAILDRMPDELSTLPEMLKDAGYSTAMFGKWHLGTMADDPPVKHGFDVYYGGGESGPRSYFSPYHLEFLADGPKGEHVDDRLTAEAVSYLDSHRKKEANRPFFLYMSYYSVHAPWQAKPDLVEQFSQTMAIANRQINPVYAAMMSTLDNNVGKLLNYLERNGLMEHTIIVFSSDNGGLERIPGFGRGQRGPFPVGMRITSNEPLRGGKGTIYEGGVRVPTILYLPEASGGRVEDTPIVIWDWMPTLLQAAGLQLPETHAIDGVNLLPLARGENALVRESIHWHFPHYQINPSPDLERVNFSNRPGTSLRKGQWKFIYRFDAPPELYDLKNDPTELKNVARAQPEKAEELAADVWKWLREINAYLPLRNVNYRPQPVH